MRKVSIGLILTLAFTFLVTLLIGVGWLGLSRMDIDNADFRDVFNSHWAKVQLARNAVLNANLNNRITMEIFMLDRTEGAAKLLERRNENGKKIVDDLKLVETRIQSEKERELVNRIVESREPFRLSYAQAVDLLIKDKNVPKAREMMVGVTVPLLIKYHDAWNDFVQF